MFEEALPFRNSMSQKQAQQVLLREFGWRDGEPTGPYIREMLRHGLDSKSPRFAEAFLYGDWDHLDSRYEAVFDWESPANRSIKAVEEIKDIAYEDPVSRATINYSDPDPKGADMSSYPYIVSSLTDGRIGGANVYNVNESNYPVLAQTLAQTLVKAIAATRKIVRREHIKADRIERVNHFITCLRRELCSQKTHTEGLCRKEVWYDVGVLSPNQVHAALIEEALSSANRMLENDSKTDIECDLQELGGSIHGMNVLVADMERINNESEGVLSKLIKLFPA